MMTLGLMIFALVSIILASDRFSIALSRIFSGSSTETETNAGQPGAQLPSSAIEDAPSNDGGHRRVSIDGDGRLRVSFWLSVQLSLYRVLLPAYEGVYLPTIGALNAWEAPVAPPIGPPMPDQGPPLPPPASPPSTSP